MCRLLFAMMPLCLIAAVAIPSPVGGEEPDVAAGDWPWWRGPLRNGTARSDQDLPLAWDESTNVAWSVSVPGRGHSSPIVVGNQVVITTADRERDLQSVLCYDRVSGGLQWETVVHRGGLMKKNKKSSQASSTAACDGERIFVNFLNDGGVYTTALDRKGVQLWQTRISDYVIHQGYGSSPAIFESLVIVSADNKGGGAIAALDRVTGKVAWRHDRPPTPNYPSPVILRTAGREQLLFTGCDLVSSFDPRSGEKLWEISAATTECVTSTVTDGQLVYSSGGYPRNHVAAIRADGSGEIVWENTSRVYVPSMLVKDGFLYAVMDAGVAVCWKADDGTEMWKKRLGGDFSASPVLVGDQIFATNESGTTSIYRADPSGFTLIARNPLGDDAFATPTLCGDRIYSRVGVRTGDRRQEMLYCLAKQGPSRPSE